MKPPLEYRQPRSPASSSGRTADFGSAKTGSNPGAGTNAFVISDDVPGDLTAIKFPGLSPEQILAHKRATKAAQMRRYRARQKDKAK